TEISSRGFRRLLWRPQNFHGTLERGESNVSFESLAKISTALEITPAQLVSGVEKRAPHCSRNTELRAHQSRRESDRVLQPAAIEENYCPRRLLSPPIFRFASRAPTAFRARSDRCSLSSRSSQ